MSKFAENEYNTSECPIPILDDGQPHISEKQPVSSIRSIEYIANLERANDELREKYHIIQNELQQCQSEADHLRKRNTKIVYPAAIFGSLTVSLYSGFLFSKDSNLSGIGSWIVSSLLLFLMSVIPVAIVTHFSFNFRDIQPYNEWSSFSLRNIWVRGAILVAINFIIVLLNHLTCPV